ncbi:MutS-related protein [Caldanaerobacter sp.]|uniref:lysine 5,6-aminomutase reactivase ATPase KamC n=1 Tax=Caldanaerobacter sp. TaxID=2930036 RepID=UPI003C733E5F
MVIDIKFLTEKEREQVGFEYVISKLQVVTPYGKEELKNVRPYKREEKERLRQEYEYIDLIGNSLKENEKIFFEILKPLLKIKDIRNSLRRCREGQVLDEVEFFEIKVFAMLSEELKPLIEKLGLDIEDIKLVSLHPVLDLLDPQKKRVATFHVYDEYSCKLREIREKKREIERKIFTETDKNKIESLKQKRLEIVALEQKEEFEVKRNLSEKLSNYVDILEKNIKAIGRLDFLMAKAKLAIEYGGVKPVIGEEIKVIFEDAINPQVADILKRQGKKFTPLTVELKRGTTVITGANMGGKTVALRTFTLNLLLATMGFFPFAKKVSFPMLDFIHFVSEDLQSVARGLSSFGAEVMKLKEIMEDVKRGTGFVALDEIARGTNPEEGLYIVKAVSKYLNGFSSITVLATHYEGVVEEDMIHYQVVGLKNVNFEELSEKIMRDEKNSVKILQDYMDYRLERVDPSCEIPKDALNICKLLGLEKEVIDLAETYYKRRRGYEREQA